MRSLQYVSVNLNVICQIKSAGENDEGRFTRSKAHVHVHMCILYICITFQLHQNIRPVVMTRQFYSKFYWQSILLCSLLQFAYFPANHSPTQYTVTELEIAVGHRPFSDQLQDLADQN